MGKWNLARPNEKGRCPPYEGPCEVGKPCSARYKMSIRSFLTNKEDAIINE